MPGGFCETNKRPLHLNHTMTQGFLSNQNQPLKSGKKAPSKK